MHMDMFMLQLVHPVKRGIIPFGNTLSCFFRRMIVRGTVILVVGIP